MPLAPLGGQIRIRTTRRYSTINGKKSKEQIFFVFFPKNRRPELLLKLLFLQNFQKSLKDNSETLMFFFVRFFFSNKYHKFMVSLFSLIFLCVYYYFFCFIFLATNSRRSTCCCERFVVITTVTVNVQLSLLFCLIKIF